MKSNRSQEGRRINFTGEYASVVRPQNGLVLHAADAYSLCGNPLQVSKLSTFFQHELGEPEIDRDYVYSWSIGNCNQFVNEKAYIRITVFCTSKSHTLRTPNDLHSGLNCAPGILAMLNDAGCAQVFQSLPDGRNVLRFEAAQDGAAAGF